VSLGVGSIVIVSVHRDEVKFRAGRKLEVGELEAQEHGAGRADPKPPERTPVGQGFPAARVVDPEVQRNRSRDPEWNARLAQRSVLGEQGGHVQRRQDSLIDRVRVANIVGEALGRCDPLGVRDVADERYSEERQQAGSRSPRHSTSSAHGRLRVATSLRSPPL